MTAGFPDLQARSAASPRAAPPADRARSPGLSRGLARALRDFLESCETPAGAGAPAPGAAARWCRDLRGSLETALLQQETMILSLHVPLATPPGFRELLAGVFGEGFFASYHEITDCRGRAVPEFPPAARCIHGHIPLLRLRARYPGALLVTWVMDPVQRVAAQYRYWQREPDWRNPLCEALHRQQWSLLEFARQPGARNEMARFCGDLRPADFAFVGLMEEFPRSVELLLRRLQVTAVPVFEDYRRNARPLAPAPLPAAEAAEIAGLNPDSCRIYAQCRDWFQQACRAAGV